MRVINIITQLQKLYSLPRDFRVGNKLPALLLKKPLYMGDLSPAPKNIHWKTWNIWK